MTLNTLKKKNGKKILMQFATVIVVLTYAPSSISQIKNGPEEVMMESLDVAPWNGVLVPHERYMYYKEELEVCKYKEANPAPCPNQQYEVFPWFVAGALLGLIGGLQAR